MQDKKCSRCDSVNVHKNVGNNWHQDGIVIQTNAAGNFNARFQTEVYFCLDCHNLDTQFLEASTFPGKRKTLAESVQVSRNWRKA